MKHIPYGRQDLSDEDIEAVVEVLRSDWLTQGPKVPEFESRIATYCRAKHAVAVNSATSALHIACLALDLNSNDWLWTSPITFVASANCGLYCGAKVDFVDIDPKTYNLCANALAHKLQVAKDEGRLPKIVVPVHLTGQPCNMAAIYELAQEYGFRVIEDASHAIGGSYKQESIGNCRFSDVTIFSFHPVKIITSGEGGMALTNDPMIAAKMTRLRSHGITRETSMFRRAADGPWYFEQIELGLNYRMTDVQAALGISQCQRLEKFVTRRGEIAEIYDQRLAGSPLLLPWQHPDGKSARHLYVVRLKLKETAKSHRTIFEFLRSQNIGVGVHYIPVHTHPYYQELGFKYGDFPEAESYYKEAISLPIYPALTDVELDRVVIALEEAFDA